MDIFGGHHKIGHIQGLFGSILGSFLNVKVPNWGYFWGLLKFKIFWGYLKFLVFFLGEW